MTGQVVDTVSNIATVKLFAHGDFEDQATLQSLDGYRTATIRVGRVNSTFRFWLMFLAGMLPVALGLHGDSSFRAPMAIAVIGGLLLSTVLTLVIVPAAFTLADDVERKMGPLLSRLFTNGGRDAKAEPHPAE